MEPTPTPIGTPIESKALFSLNLHNKATPSEAANTLILAASLIPYSPSMFQFAPSYNDMS
jgi:hypothetical protein